jgi:catechol 2,3-dioxygenase
MNRHLSQLAHVELLSPKPDESAAFLTDVIGLEESHREGQSIYFRAWGEWLHSSLVVTESETSGLGHASWRTRGPEDLKTIVKQISKTTDGEGWVEDSVGHGPAFRFRAPEGHLHEVFWETELYEAPPEMASRYPNRPQRFNPRGCGVRRIDHVTLGGVDVKASREFYMAALGSRYMEGFGIKDKKELGAFLTTNAGSHDLAVVDDPTGITGRLNHVCYWIDTEVELRRAADILMECEQPLELGPERHGVGENFNLYTREPGGNRIEMNTGPGYFNFMPDWEPAFWDLADGPGSMYLREIPFEFHKLGSPPAEGELEQEADRWKQAFSSA